MGSASNGFILIDLGEIYRLLPGFPASGSVATGNETVWSSFTGFLPSFSSDTTDTTNGRCVAVFRFFLFFVCGFSEMLLDAVRGFEESFSLTHSTASTLESDNNNSNNNSNSNSNNNNNNSRTQKGNKKEAKTRNEFLHVIGGRVGH